MVKRESVWRGSIDVWTIPYSLVQEILNWWSLTPGQWQEIPNTILKTEDRWKHNIKPLKCCPRTESLPWNLCAKAGIRLVFPVYQACMWWWVSITRCGKNKGGPLIYYSIQLKSLVLIQVHWWVAAYAGGFSLSRKFFRQIIAHKRDS